MTATLTLVHGRLVRNLAGFVFLSACFLLSTAHGDEKPLSKMPVNASDQWGIDWSDPALSEQRADYESRVKKIFILHSYHSGYWWSDEILNTIRKQLWNSGVYVEIWIEYLDTKNQTTHLMFGQLERLFKLKYSEIQFELLIAIDDNALNFLLEYKDDIFPGVPVVFCGIEESDPDTLSGRDDITGVIERESFTETVELALRLHPTARQVVLLGDSTPVWLGPWETDLAELTEKLRGKIDFIHYPFPELSMEELLEKTRQLGDESIVVLLGLLNPRDEQPYTFEQAAKMIEQNCKAPIYVFVERAIDSGAVGGNMVDATLQGRAAGQLAVRILKGENVKEIPVVRESPNKFLFDYPQLKRFGIALSELPEESIILNQPYSFYQEYKVALLSTAATIAGLSMIIIILSVNIFRRKRAEKKLLDYQGQLKHLASELSTAEEQLRRSIGTKLHDQIGQQLVISKMELETLCHDRPASDNITQTLRKVADSLDHTITEVRSLTFDLSSPILYELGLEAALAEWLSENIRHKHNIETEFHDDGRPKPLDDDVRALLFRITQELLVNVVRHASAKKVRLSVGRITDRIHITVEDDGIGCDSEKLTSIPNRSGGFGLFNIKERLEHIGGKIDLDSTPGRGCKTTITSLLKDTKAAEGEKS